MTTIEYGYNHNRKTLADFVAWSGWIRLHPEVQRRLMALIVDSGYVIGVGSTIRTAAGQIALWNSRYTRVNYWTSLFYDGSYWIHTSGASAAIPGQSYHEPVIDEDGNPDFVDGSGFAVAADTLNATLISDARLATYGLRNFDEEAWHVQPIEWPAARRNWNAHPIPLTHWQLPNDEPNPPTPEGNDDDMIALDYKPNTDQWTAFVWTGTELGHVFNGHSDSILRIANIKRVVINDDQLLGIIQSAHTTTKAPPTLTPAMLVAWQKSRLSFII